MRVLAENRLVMFYIFIFFLIFLEFGSHVILWSCHIHCRCESVMMTFIEMALVMMYGINIPASTAVF